MVSLVILLLGIAVARQRTAGSDLYSDLAVVAVVLAGGFVSWLVTRWQIAGGVVRINTGLLRRESRRIPLSQLQAVDLVQTGIARMLGLAELQLRVAGGDARGARLACLRRAEAEELRRELLALAALSAASATSAGSAAGTAATAVQSVPGQSGLAQSVAVQSVPGQPVPGQSVAGQFGSAAAPAARAMTTPGEAGPERLLFRVRTARLPVAILASRAGAIAVVVAVATGLAVLISGHTRIVAPFLPVVLGVLLALWRQLNGEYGTTVAAAHDGIRLRSGLIQTTAETIRPGRIQAVRLVEPLAWRPLGWCRLEVDVAGVRQRRENHAEGQRLRALIPVGTRAEAEQMLGELLASPLRPASRPPRAARWKAPLSYHFLSWAGDDRYVVAARGRICRQTTWVPLEKVQSIRWVQGPVQRRLGLGSVHLDVAGRRVTASIEDRSNAEALEILGRLPDLARSARTRFG
jgi:putative membrane protein